MLAGAEVVGVNMNGVAIFTFANVLAVIILVFKVGKYTGAIDALSTKVDELNNILPLINKNSQDIAVIEVKMASLGSEFIRTRRTLQDLRKNVMTMIEEQIGQRFGFAQRETDGRFNEVKNRIDGVETQLQDYIDELRESKTNGK